MEDIVDKTYKTTRSIWFVFDKKKFKNYIFHICLVYVFIGEHIAMIDFIKCLQKRNLLSSGEYMVISVDDEIYNPKKHTSIVKRGKFV